MAFAKKETVKAIDGRPKASAMAMREAKVKHLKDANTPEARATLKKMNDKVYRGANTNLTNWFTPNGKKHTAR